MENLRVLIEEGKKAAAEGRLSAALRKYETAMVTLPEAYKPRLRNKIARLEARLDDEEARSPGTPARLSRKACREAAQSFGAKDPGPLDLLQVAVNDIAAAAAAAGGGGGGGSASGRLIAGGTFSSPSPRRPSPLVRGLAGAGDATPNASGVAGKRAMTPRDQDLSFGIDRLGDRLTASSLTASTTAADPVGAPTSPVRSPLPASLQAARINRGDDCEQGQPWVFSAAEAGSAAGIGDEDDDHCGLGGAEEEAGSDEEMEGLDTQERLREMNRGLSGKLEQQIVDIINKASSADLMELHGIGQQRAQLILKKRAEAPFETLADLKRINMYEKEIWTLGRRNMLECLEVCRSTKPEDGAVVNNNSSSTTGSPSKGTRGP
ncbi:unnamed protein product [Scytosiphon promiscuus]